MIDPLLEFAEAGNDSPDVQAARAARADAWREVGERIMAAWQALCDALRPAFEHCVAAINALCHSVRSIFRSLFARYWRLERGHPRWRSVMAPYRMPRRATLLLRS